MKTQPIASASITSSPFGVDALRWLPPMVILFAGLEMAILRLLTRTAIHIPGLPRIRPLYVTISEVGRSAFYIAAVLLIVTLVLQAKDLATKRGSSTALAGAAGLALFLGAAAITRVGDPDGGALGAATVSALLLLAPWASGGSSGRSRVVRALIASAFVVTAATAVGQPSPDASGAGSGWLSLGGEMLALAGALATPVLVRTRNRAALVWGAMVAGLTLAGLLANPSTVKILLLWNLGLAGYLPSVLYGLAAGAITYTVLALRAEDRAPSAAGLLFLFMGGLGLHSTYQTGLVLAGLTLLGTGARMERATSGTGRRGSSVQDGYRPVTETGHMQGDPVDV